MSRRCRRKVAQCRPLVVERIWTVSPRNPRVYGLGPLPGVRCRNNWTTGDLKFVFSSMDENIPFNRKVTGLLLRGRTILWNMEVCDMRASRRRVDASRCLAIGRHLRLMPLPKACRLLGVYSGAYLNDAYSMLSFESAFWSAARAVGAS